MTRCVGRQKTSPACQRGSGGIAGLASNDIPVELDTLPDHYNDTINLQYRYFHCGWTTFSCKLTMPRPHHLSLPPLFSRSSLTISAREKAPDQNGRCPYAEKGV